LRRGAKPIYESELVDEIGKSPLYIALREIEEGLIVPSRLPEQKSENREIEITRLADEDFFPYEGEVKVSKIIREFEQMLEEMKNYLSTTAETTEETPVIKEETLEILDSQVTEAEESIEVLQEKELEELEEKLEEE
jgi:hypothetical protein